VAASPQPPIREFAEVERDIRDALMRLNNTFKPESKRKLLRQLRELIEEADVITYLEYHAGLD
jgi:hypothetical protein